MGRDVAQYTDEWFESRGYTFNVSSNTWIPPVPKSAYIRQQKAINTHNKIEGEKTIGEIPPIKLDIKTEFFIRGNVPSKKNSKRIVPIKTKEGKMRSILIPSELHEAYKKETIMQYQIFGIEFLRAVKFYGLEYPLRIEFTYVRGSKHRFDYTNATDTILDLFTHHKWIEDDSADHIIPSFQPYEYDKQNAGVKIKLLKQ